jgi:hypothetical protein
LSASPAGQVEQDNVGFFACAVEDDLATIRRYVEIADGKAPAQRSQLPLATCGEVDVLNALNDTAEEGLATENLFSPNFGLGTSFVDPCRAMFAVRLNLGRD